MCASSSPSENAECGYVARYDPIDSPNLGYNSMISSQQLGHEFDNSLSPKGNVCMSSHDLGLGFDDGCAAHDDVSRYGDGCGIGELPLERSSSHFYETGAYSYW